LVTRLGQEKAILSLPWLRKINPNIDWSKGTLQFREPEAVTIQLGHTAEKAPYVPRICPFKAEGWQYRADLKEKITLSKGTYILRRRPFKAGGRQYRLDLKNLEQGEELSLDDKCWTDAEWTPPIRSAVADWKIEDRLVFYKGRCFIPEKFDI